MFEEGVYISIPFSEVFSHSRNIVSSEKFRIVEVFIFFFLGNDILDFWVYF